MSSPVLQGHSTGEWPGAGSTRVSRLPGHGGTLMQQHLGLGNRALRGETKRVALRARKMACSAARCNLRSRLVGALWCLGTGPASRALRDNVKGRRVCAAANDRPWASASNLKRWGAPRSQGCAPVDRTAQAARWADSEQTARSTAGGPHSRRITQQQREQVRRRIAHADQEREGGSRAGSPGVGGVRGGVAWRPVEKEGPGRPEPKQAATGD